MEKAANKKNVILITGASGFAGRWLIKELKGTGEIIGLDRSGGAIEDTQIHSVDITDAHEVNALITKIKPDQIYHLAGFAKTGAESAEIMAVNVAGTKNILEGAKNLNQPVKILLASSAYVYGPHQTGPISETTAPDPVGDYALSKAKMEELAIKYVSGHVEIVISRAFNHTGPGQQPGFVIPDFCKQIAEIEKGKLSPVMQVGNLKSSRDFSDVRDIVEGYKILMEKGQSGNVYNLGSGTGQSIQEILDKLLALSKKPIEIEIDKSRFRSSECKELTADITKAKTLGFLPKIPLDQTLEETLAWWRKQIR